MDIDTDKLEVLSNVPLENSSEKKNKYIESKRAFYLNHVWMVITVIVTLLTAMVLTIPLHRYIILLEAAISTISTTIYYFLHQKIVLNEKNNEDVDWKSITVLRYNGWVFSTPIMLIAFLLFLSSTTKIKLTIPIAVTIIILDWIMLLFGYLGEIGKITRNVAFVGGFIPLFIIFGIIYQTFLRNKYMLFNYLMFAFFVIFWSLYGIGYMWELESKNYLMNVLDLLSKSGFGLAFAFYFLYKR
jgi:bacteriorhodopsin